MKGNHGICEMYPVDCV